MKDGLETDAEWTTGINKFENQSVICICSFLTVIKWQSIQYLFLINFQDSQHKSLSRIQIEI